MIEESGAYQREEPPVSGTGKSITEEDKKDLEYWMAYREPRPPSPSPQVTCKTFLDESLSFNSI